MSVTCGVVGCRPMISWFYRPRSGYASQLIRGIERIIFNSLMLAQRLRRWFNIKHHWFNVSCELGGWATHACHF